MNKHLIKMVGDLVEMAYVAGAGGKSLLYAQINGNDREGWNLTGKVYFIGERPFKYKRSDFTVILVRNFTILMCDKLLEIARSATESNDCRDWNELAIVARENNEAVDIRAFEGDWSGWIDRARAEAQRQFPGLDIDTATSHFEGHGHSGDLDSKSGWRDWQRHFLKGIRARAIEAARAAGWRSVVVTVEPDGDDVICRLRDSVDGSMSLPVERLLKQDCQDLHLNARAHDQEWEIATMAYHKNSEGDWLEKVDFD